MKTNLLLGALLLMSATSYAQTVSEPYVVNNVLAMTISSNGSFAVAQDELGNTLVINTNNKGITYYTGNYPGNGNCISDKGMVVGQTMEGISSVMRNGSTQTPEVFIGYAQSALNAVTPDGTRACGYIANNGLGAYDVPFYCDIDEKGNFGMPVILPYPIRDFFGNVPQFITAVWISDDGHTIIGQVQDSTGFYTNPIVYQEDSEGNWSYTQPTQSLFNPEGLEIPKWPVFNQEPPAITDYMTTENAQKWAKALNDYENSVSTINPWDHILDYMSQQKYQEYQDAYQAYVKDRDIFYQQIDEYWQQMAKVENDSSFALGVMALNPAGTIMAGCRMVTNPEDGGMTDVAEGYLMYLFNLKDNTFRAVQSEYGMLVPKQIFDDGTVIAIEMASYADYVLLPDAEDFIPFSEYLSTIHPDWLPWIEASLPVRIDGQTLLATGIVSFSSDLRTMIGGYLGINGMFSYIFKGDVAAVENIGADIPGHSVVYDLNGRKVLETENPEDIRRLSKGIYIVNGKKVAL